jgi:isoleucyl-tRNA synthetase
MASARAFSDIIRDEVNVRDVVFTSDVDAVGKRELQVLPKALGPRIGGEVQKVIAAVKAGDWNLDGDVPIAGGVRLNEGEFTLKLVAAEGSASAGLATVSGVVVLDVEVTPELEAEGVARDMIRTLQQTRRSLGLDVSDRIAVSIDGPPATLAQLGAHVEMIGAEVLATAVQLSSGSGEPQHVEVLESGEVRVWVSRAS